MSFGGKQRRRHDITIYSCVLPLLFYSLIGSDYSREVGARDLSFGIFANLVLIMIPINGVDHRVVKLHTLLDYTGPTMYGRTMYGIRVPSYALAAFSHTDP